MNNLYNKKFFKQWNLPDNRGLFQDFLNLFDCSEIIQESYRKLPKPPRNVFFYFEEIDKFNF